MPDRMGCGRRAATTTTDRFAELHALVGSPPLDLPLADWRELYQLTVEFKPDLVLELGRGYGNSTCVFVEAVHGAGGRVVSIGNDGNREWERSTVPRLEPLVGRRWFRPLTALHADIRDVDYAAILNRRRRVLVYWDAHGRDVAETVLADVLPRLPSENLVIVDDVWPRGGPHLLPPEHQAGPFASLFDEIEPLWDYLNAAQIPFEQRSRAITFRAPLSRI
jgi:hypothetical protein